MAKYIPLPDGDCAIVDDDDYDFLTRFDWHKSRCNRSFAVMGRCPGSRNSVYLHRAIMDPPINMQVDHINGDRLDNRKCNLRLCNTSQNTSSRGGIGGSSQYKGVYWHKTEKKWVAQITSQGQKRKIGQYSAEADAAKAYDEAARAYHGEFAKTNFPKSRLEEIK